jgi:heat shock protein HslJ
MDEGTHQLLEHAVVDVEPRRGLDDVKGRARQRHARGRLLAGITAAIVAIVGVGGVIAILNDGTPNPYIGVSASPSDTSQQASALQAKIDEARLELESLNQSLSRDLHRLSDAKRHGNLLEVQRVSARLRVERAEVARIEALIQHLDDRLHRLLIAPSGSPPSATLTGTPWTMAALTWQGKPIVPTAENSPTAFFEANGRLGGTFGCNSYSATFRTGEGGAISVRNWQQTLCFSDSEFVRAMMAAQRYRIDGQFLLLPGGRRTAIVFTSGAPMEPSEPISSPIAFDPYDIRRFGPPSTNAQPSLSAAQALAAFMIVDRPFRLQPGTSAWLGVYTWPSARLAWGFKYETTCLPSVGPGKHTVSPAIPAPCTRWLFLNANTGRMLEAIAQQ